MSKCKLCWDHGVAACPEHGLPSVRVAAFHAAAATPDPITNLVAELKLHRAELREHAAISAARFVLASDHRFPDETVAAALKLLRQIVEEVGK